MVPTSLFLQEVLINWAAVQHIWREIPGIYCAIRHFTHLREAHKFHVLTEHKLVSKPDKHSPRQIQHLDFISQFTSDIWQVAGWGNPKWKPMSSRRIHLATYNSRHPSISQGSTKYYRPVNYIIMQTENNSLSFAKGAMPMCSDQLLCDTSTGKPHPYVPDISMNNL